MTIANLRSSVTHPASVRKMLKASFLIYAESTPVSCVLLIQTMSDDEEWIPDAAIDVIQYGLMEDPVYTSDGHTCESIYIAST
jgi:hypothetical protein